MPKHNRLVIIGLDGGTLDVIRPLAEEGLLPNLASLLGEGAWGTLLSTVPPQTAPAWATFGTGVNPGRHGVFHFRRIDDAMQDDGQPRLVNALSIRAPTLWRVASQMGLRVGVINVPVTYPPEAVNGFLIAGMLTPPDAALFTHPPELSQSLAGYEIDVRSGGRYGAVENLDFQDRGILRWLCESLDIQLEKRAQAAVHLAGEYGPDLLVLVFTETDRVHHYLWRYLSSDPCLPTAPGEAFFYGWVRAFYRKLDAAIGRVWDAMGPDAVRLIVSDHGFGPMPLREFYPNVWLRRRGWLHLRTKGLRGVPTYWRNSLGQEWARRALFFLPRHRQRAVRAALGGRFSLPVDWSRTRAYAVPLSTSVAGIRILDEPSSPGYQDFRDTIIGELSSLADPVTGRLLVDQVWRREELYDGPFLGRAPDLLVLMGPEHRAVSGLAGRSYVPKTAARISQWTGSHRLEGILAAGGAPIRATHLPPTRLEDIAPTALYLLGMPIPDTMAGRVVREAIHPGWLLDAPPQRVTLSFPRADEGGAEWDRPEDEIGVLDRLRSLGYLD